MGIRLWYHAPQPRCKWVTVILLSSADADMLAVDMIVTLSSHEVRMHAPAVIFGGWLGGSALALIAACYVSLVAWLGRRWRVAWQTMALIAIIAGLVLSASQFTPRGMQALRIHNSGSWTEGGSMKCAQW
jgi:hypothetical protein